MSPKPGRPIVGNEPKNKQIALRATESTVKKFQECADITGRTKTDLLESMVNELYERLTKK
nr:MAG TPA: NikA, BACTERIAL CONJUGATION, RELAXASE, DNA [Caudoviricetes sp.]